MINKDVGKYEIVKELGKGGMATIYHAIHKDLNRKVALKVMHPHLAAEEEARIRFEREAKAIAKLEHVNILQIYDFGSYEGSFYIAMELIEGNDAEKIIKKHGPLPPEITAVIFCGVANGLYQAHLNNIIHRDIKLSNIIVKDDGLAKLSDFGIVKMEDVASLTQSHSVVGTPYYLSPEQVEDKKPSFKSDIFSFGVSMYYAVTGKYHFKADTVPAAFNIISSGKYVTLKESGIYVPSDLSVVIERCMEKDPKDRFEDASVLAQELNSYLYRNQIANDKNEVSKYLKNPKNYRKELRDSSVKLRLDRAKTYKEKGLVFEALREYEDILQQDPDNKEVQENIAKLGKARLADGQTDLGLETMVMPRKKGMPKPVVFSLLFLVVAAVALIIYFGMSKPAGDTSEKPMDWKDSLLSMKMDTATASMFSVVKKETSAAQINKEESKKEEPKVKKQSVKRARQMAKKPRRPRKKVTARSPALDGAKAEEKKDALIKEAAAPEPAVTCNGYLFVFSELVGNIFLNDKKYGYAPTKNKLKIPCGDYLLKVENMGGNKYTQKITVNSEKTVKIKVRKDQFK
jgi:serine/threonine protein kinase